MNARLHFLIEHLKLKEVRIVDLQEGTFYADLIFEPGVTTRHLDPVRDLAEVRRVAADLEAIEALTEPDDPFPG